MEIEFLREEGFGGFEAPVELSERNFETVPAVPGIYVVLRARNGRSAQFAAASTGGRFKGRSPAVPIPVLAGKWVADAVILYIGRAGDLQGRIRQLVRFGKGRAIGHWGGRYLWQLNEELLVAWAPAADPEGAERLLLAKFLTRYGKLPFANLRN